MAKRKPFALPVLARLPQPRKAVPTVAAVKGKRGGQVKVLGDLPGPIPSSILVAYPLITTIEWAVWWSLERLGLQKGTDWDYQVAFLGGRSRRYLAGGSVLDFVVYRFYPAVMLTPMGYWHFERGPEPKLHDLFILRRLRREEGIVPVVLEERHLQSNPLFYVREAVFRHVDYSRYRGQY